MDVFYSVQGVPLTDDRWAGNPVLGPTGRHLTGAWELLKGTALLPNLPGFRVTRFERPGQHGESQAQFAPITANGFPLAVRVYAVDADPASPTFRQTGSTVGERLRMMQYAAEDLFFRTQIGASGAKGYLEVQRVYSIDGESRYAVGRFTGATEPEYGPDYKWADYHLIFSNPSGTWYSDEVTVERTLEATETEILLPAGTAPVWDAKIAIRPDPDTGLEPGSRFLNDMGVGFRFPYRTNNRNWWVLDMASRLSGNAGSGSNPNWGVSLTNARAIAEVGRPQGAALLINPGVAGDSGRVGVIKVRLSVPGEIRVRFNPRYL